MKNGTKASLTDLINTFNAAGEIKADRDVVIAPTAIHIGFVQGLLRPEIQIAAQNIWKVNVLVSLRIFMTRDTVHTMESFVLPC